MYYNEKNIVYAIAYISVFMVEIGVNTTNDTI